MDGLEEVAVVMVEELKVIEGVEVEAEVEVW